MRPNLRKAEDVLWERFYRADTHLFYEYDASDATRLPTDEDIRARIPNTAGWKTGMEDCCLNGGALLDGYVTAWRVTGDPEWADKARETFLGLARLGDIPRRPGFVARGLAPGSSEVYPNSSADQYTTWVVGMFAFATSPLANDAERRLAADLVVQVARLVESFHDDIPTIDLERSIFGDTSAIRPDRACRLLLFYRVAHALSGDARWGDLYRRKLEQDDRARLMARFGPEPCAMDENHHAHFQSQSAWRTLCELEDDPAIRSAYEDAMVACARHVVHTIDTWNAWAASPHDEAPRWRDVWADYIQRYPDVDYTDPAGRKVFTLMYTQRNPALMTDLKGMRNPMDALAICMMCPDEALRREAAERARPALESYDFSRVRFGTALACVGGGYWRGVETGLLPGY